MAVNGPGLQRRTLFDSLEPLGADRNLYCRRGDLGNEASVETFFLARMISDLGFRDDQVRTKESLEKLAVGKGRRRERYRPDYALLVGGLPVCIIDAKATDASLDAWTEQCSGYCLALNRKFPDANPAKYFVLTNGIATQVFAWDKDEPLLELSFADFNWGSGLYARVRALLNPTALATRNTSPPARPDMPFRLEAVKAEQARQLFAACHQIIRKEGAGAALAFHEFVKVLFVKLWADQKLRTEPLTRDLFKDGDEQVSLPRDNVIFSVHWIESREREGVVNPVESVLFSNLRDDIEHQIALQRKKRIFEPGERIRLNSDTIKDIVRKLEHYDLFGVDEDLNGRLFETYLSATMRGRDLGQYFTPRSVVELMTRMADLQATPAQQDRVLDACCGSGGFLIEALTIMRNAVKANSSLNDSEKERLIEVISNGRLYGIDFAKDPPLSRVARIKMYLHGDGGSRIYEGDALDKSVEIPRDAPPELVTSLNELRGYLAEPFDVVLTNPPFSMTKDAKKAADLRVLTQYQMARKSPRAAALRRSLRSNIMFMERYAELVRPGGKFLTVIDDTLLASDGEIFRATRALIRERFLVRAIISLPGDAFKRQGSRVKTSILVLEKKHDASEGQPACYGFFAETLGVDDLAPRASRADIEDARAASREEMQVILREYRQFLGGESVERGLVLSSDRLQNRLDLKSCAAELGRMAKDWRAQGADLKLLRECVTLVTEEVSPAAYPRQGFKLLKVSYEGHCILERVRMGSRIKAKTMYRVRAGQMVFSLIRATDGAIGIVPPELDGALVSTDSYVVFACDTPQDAHYLWAVLRSYELRADMQAKSTGSGRYVTEWPDVGDWLQVPWMPGAERQQVGDGLTEAWELERQAYAKRHDAMETVHALGIESEESVTRWQRSRAPR